MWEAKNCSEAFNLARKALKPPQAPALGSGRESDLTLLAALSCKDAALYEQEQRRYSSAAEILEEGTWVNEHIRTTIVKHNWQISRQQNWQIKDFDSKLILEVEKEEV